MDTWTNMEWHYEVHHRFGEQLVYYLLRVRPFEAQEVIENLTSLLSKEELQSVRVFKIIGPNELVIRAWHHSNVTPDFQGWLREALVYGTEVRPFFVTHVHLIASGPPNVKLPEGSDIVDNLFDEDTIRAVQNGHDDPLLQRLLDSKIVFPRDQDGPDPTKFYIAVTLAQKDENIQADAADELCEHIQHNMPAIKKTSVYRGYGFCDIFIKGEVEANLFNVGELIDWIYVTLRKYGANTETYIVVWPRPFVETPDKISEATFKAIQGKDLFVQTIIPELYDKYYSRRKEIEPVMLHGSKQVIGSHRKLIHDYLLAFLEAKMTEIGKVLFTYFTELEEFLRENHREFIGRNKQVPGKIYSALNIAEQSTKHITLGDLFNIYSYVLKQRAIPEELELYGDWNALTKLRNKTLHGDLNYKDEWASSLDILIKSLLRVEKLVTVVMKETNAKYDFTYVPVARIPRN